MRNSVGILVSFVLLASCGGDGAGGSVAGGGGSTPATPSPTPSPSATSTPAGQTLLTLNMDQALIGFSGENDYHRDASGKVTDDTGFSVGAGSPGNYLASTKTYKYEITFYNLPKTVNVTTTLSYDPSASTPGYSVYDAQPNGALLVLKRLDIGTANPVLPLIYSSLAVNKASYYDSTTGLTGYDVVPQVFGLTFKYDQVKLTGSGVYAGVILGQAEAKGSTHVYDISGTVNLTINYDATTFAGQLHLLATDDKSGQQFDLGVLPLKEDVARGVLDFFYSKTTGQDILQGRLMGSMGEEFIAGIDAHFADPQTAGVVLKVSAVAGARK